MIWPTQAEANEFYGNPVGHDGNVSSYWVAQNLVKIVPPWTVWFGDIGHQKITAITIHRKCAESARRIMMNTWDKIAHHQPLADSLGISSFSGSFNYRSIRGGKRLSMHSYGCAWDWDYPNNMMGDKTPKFGFDHPFVVAHLEEGWVWGADWDGDHEILDSNPIDGMHFQAARVR